MQQPRQGAVSQQFSAGLTTRAVVGFVGRVADALHFGAAVRASLSVSPMHSHAFPKAVTFSGNCPWDCARSFATHSLRVCLVALYSLRISSGFSFWVSATG